MAKVDYGIEEIILTPRLATGEFPDFNTATDKIKVTNIVIDSFQFNQDDDETTNINWEDYNDVGLILRGNRGLKSMVVQSDNFDNEAVAYLLGMTEDADGYMIENPDFVLGNQSMRVKTREVGQYGALLHEWVNLKVAVKKLGTLGKNGLTHLELTLSQELNIADTGEQKPNYRFTTVA